MADDNEIIAKFVADIEQYKAQIAEMGEVNKQAQKSTDAVTDSTEKLSTKTTSSAKAIKTLGQGLSGITGLLAITGRLIGVDTQKLQELIFASQQFASVAQKIVDAQRLANAATARSTTAKATNEAATIAQTTAERILNAVRSAGVAGIGLLITGITALAVGIYNYVRNLKDEERQTKRNQELNREQIKINNDLIESFNKRIEAAGETALSEAIRTKKITEQQAEEIAANNKTIDVLTKIEQDFQKKKQEIGEQGLKDRGTIFLKEENRFLSIEEQLNLQRKQKIESAEEDLQTELGKIREKFRKIADDEKKKQNDKDKADRDAELARLKKEAEDALKLLNEQQQARDKKFAEFARKAGKTELELQIQLLEDERNELLENQNLTNDQKLLIEQTFQDRIAKVRKDAADKKKKEEEEARKKAEAEAEAERIRAEAEAKKRREKEIDDAKMVADTIFKAQQEAFDKRQELLNKEIEIQQTNIETQRKLAENGLTNTLAFEEKRAAELQRQQQLEAQKQKRIKLLETFLNSLAEYSKTDPNNALQKALLQVALAQAATAVFAQEGGIIGEIGERSNLRRKHKGGGDVLLHAQTGEGILSRSEMDNLGRRNFHLLKDVARFPVRDNIFSMPKAVIAGGVAVSNEEVVKELRGLRADIKNQPREKVDITKYGEYIRTTIENGITEVTKGKLKKPRFRG